MPEEKEKPKPRIVAWHPNYPSRLPKVLMEKAFQAGFEAGLASALQWRSMDSAPKDGTEILVGRFDEDGSEWIAVAEWWVDSWAFMVGRGKEPVLLAFEPTHWMPLPPPLPTEISEV